MEDENVTQKNTALRALSLIALIIGLALIVMFSIVYIDGMEVVPLFLYGGISFLAIGVITFIFDYKRNKPEE